MEETKILKTTEESIPSQVEEMHEAWRAAMKSAAKVQRIYNEYLTKVDQAHDIAALEEAAPLVRQLQKDLNELYDITSATGLDSAPRFSLPWLQRILSPRWWRKKRFMAQLTPTLKKQKDFNAVTVHLVNEFVNYFCAATHKMRNLMELQILFFQQITPWIDVKVQELRTQQNHNLAYNLDKILNGLDPLSDGFLEKISEQFHSLESQINERSLAAERRLQELWFQLNRERTPAPDVPTESYDLASRIELQELRSKLESITGGAPPSLAATPSKIEDPLARDFCYFVFQEVFRGTSPWLKDRFKEYLPYFVTTPEPVLDIGCGRGEFLQLMKELGKDAYGIELNQYNLQKVEEKGLRALQEDALTHLQNLKPESIGSVFCAQVVEHLPPEDVFQMLSRLHVVMKNGAAVVIETINPLSVFAYHHVYFKDPTHIFPVHPQTLVFLLRYAGFQNVDVHSITPVPESEKLQPPASIENEETHRYLKNLTNQLNQLLYSNIEYYVVGYRM